MKKLLLLLSMICLLSAAHAQFIPKPVRTKIFNYESRYHTTRDGIKIAYDIFLPSKLTGEKIPTVFYLSRYVRTVELKSGVKGLQNPGFGQVSKDEVEFFVRNGYAVIIMDARGSGASSGHRTMDFSRDEFKDAAEVMDWVVAQPWSNGKIGTTGISYLATTAEMLLINHHPSVKACIPRSGIYDLYADMCFPGGVRQGPFVKIWGFTTKSLDDNNFKSLGGIAKMFVRGINPVTGDTDRKQLNLAVLDHQKNYDVFAEILRLQYRDEVHPVLNVPIDEFSIHFRQKEIIASHVPVFRIGGWYDGALSNSVIKGLWNNPNTQSVVIGPWDHGPHDDASPYAPDSKVDYPVLSQMLLFFDRYLKDKSNESSGWPKVRYYTVGKETWNTSDQWPPASVTDRGLYFASNATMQWEQPLANDSGLNVPLFYDVSSGNGSRWNSLTTLYRYEKHTGYPKRKEQTEALFHFETTPLKDSLTITGHIRAEIYAKFPTTDATIFIYVDEVDEKGNVRYITEGMFRALHRKISSNENYISPGVFHSFRKEDEQALVPGKSEQLNFDLLPISYCVPKGHRLRISITGSDPAHFDLPAQKPDQIQLEMGLGKSRLVIPVQ